MNQLKAMCVVFALQASVAAGPLSAQDTAAVARREVYRIGDIKISLLPPDKFRELHGSAWVLMDGSNQEGTGFSKLTGMKTVPDARGAFLRMQNNGRTDAFKNPEEKQLGEIQADEFKSHTHEFSISYGASGGGFEAPGVNKGTRTPATGSRGGDETRPKNVTVNFFAKVAECPVAETGCL